MRNYQKVLAVIALSGMCWAQAAPQAEKTPAKPAKKMHVAHVRKAMKAKPVNQTADELREMKQQLNQQQSSMQAMQQQLQQTQQQLQQTQQQLQASKMSAQQASACCEDSHAATMQVQKVQADLSDVKAAVAADTATTNAMKKTVMELENPLAIHYKGVNISPNGFFEGAMFWRDRAEGATSTSSYGSTPLFGTTQAGLSEFRMSSQNSQLGFKFQSNVGKKVVTGFWQVDFNGPSNGSAIVTANNFEPRIRHAFGSIDFPSGLSFLAGQTWTLSMVNSHLIDTFSEISPIGDDNGTFVGFPATGRDVQFRVTQNFANNKAAVAISLDSTDPKYVNDGTTPAYIVGMTNVTTTQLITAAADPLPDIWVKLATNPGWGHFELKEVTRFFRDRVLPTNNTTVQSSHGTNNDTVGYGLGLGLFLPVIKKVDFYFNGMAGAGVGRYNNDGANDITLSSISDNLVPIKSEFSSFGFQFNPTPRFNFNVYAGQQYYGRYSRNLTGTKNGFGSLQAAPGTDNRTVQEIMVSGVYKWFTGPYGTFQTLGQVGVWERATWAGYGGTKLPTLASGCISAAGVNYLGDKCTAKGGNVIAILSMRYVIP